MVCGNGEKRWLIIEVNAMHLEANAGMVVFSTRLINAAKEGEEKRCKSCGKLMLRQRIQTKPRAIFWHMNHDICTPMNTIVGIP